MLRYSFVGSHDAVRSGLKNFADQTGVDELIIASAIYDHSARLHSYEIIKRR
jgi:alkanesulfonate monooxygenase SsuD/methylene tetrahydromethanopterin reductase-like flavin-dependent oxidoreductase (luciferase family)